jgi:hypothetical protein
MSLMKSTMVGWEHGGLISIDGIYSLDPSGLDCLNRWNFLVGLAGTELPHLAPSITSMFAMIASVAAHAINASLLHDVPDQINVCSDCAYAIQVALLKDDLDTISVRSDYRWAAYARKP